MPEQFESDRLLMRRFAEGDESWVYEYASDPEVTRYMVWPAHKDLSESVAYVHTTAEEWSSGKEYAWAICRKRDSHPLGAIGCSCITHRVSFGYVLRRSEWGNGYATEASAALLERLSRAPGIARIWATCDVDNVASARVLEKLGLEKEGALRKWTVRPNMPGRPARDSLMYARIISEQVPV